MKRNIIFVDASQREGSSFLGMHVAETIDRGNNYTLKMSKNSLDSGTAEKNAIIYGLMYVRDCMGGKPCVILNDNRSATEDADIIHLAHTLNSKVEWIRREMNKADAPSKMCQTTNPKQITLFRKFRESFEKRYKREGTLVRFSTEIKDDPAPLIEKIGKATYIKVFGLAKNPRKPVITADFARMVVLACEENNIEYKKGFGLKVRMSLVRKKRIKVHGGKVISFK